MKATDRHKERVSDLCNSPMDGEDDVFDGEIETFDGETSDTVRTMLPLAAGAIAELTANQLKKKEEDEAKKKLESGDAAVAKRAYDAADKQATMAEAEATGEADVNGPKHRAATALRTAANVARQKLAYYQAPAMPGMPGAPPQGYQPGQYGPQPSSIFTTKNVLIGAGVLGGIGLVVLLARRK